MVRPQIDATGARRERVAQKANESDTGRARVDANRSSRRDIVTKVCGKMIIPKHIAYSWSSTVGMDIEGRKNGQDSRKHGRETKGETEKGRRHTAGKGERREDGEQARQRQAGNQAGRAGVGEPKFRFRSGELN